MLGLLNTAHVSKQTPVVSRQSQTLQHILYSFFYTCGLNSWLVFTKPLVNAGIRAERCTVYFNVTWFTEGKTAFTDLINQLALNAIVQCIWSKPAAQPCGDLTTIYGMKLQHSYNSTWKAQQEKKTRNVSRAKYLGACCVAFHSQLPCRHCRHCSWQITMACENK